MKEVCEPLPVTSLKGRQHWSCCVSWKVQTLSKQTTVMENIIALQFKFPIPTPDAPAFPHTFFSFWDVQPLPALQVPFIFTQAPLTYFTLTKNINKNL